MDETSSRKRGAMVERRIPTAGEVAPLAATLASVGGTYAGPGLSAAEQDMEDEPSQPAATSSPIPARLQSDSDSDSDDQDSSQ